MKYPKWFPYPSAWLDAFLLLALTATLGKVTVTFLDIGLNAAYSSNSRDSAVIVVAIALLSPVILIAFVHHFIHLAISKFYPSIQAPEIGKTTGLFPALMSWWEGLMGWMVSILSSIVMFGASVVLDGLFSVDIWAYYLDPLSENYQSFATTMGLIWLVCAAYIHQIQYLVEQRLIRLK